MMFKWLAWKLQNLFINIQQKELLMFIQSLQGMTQDELATVLVFATRQRLFSPDVGIYLTEFLNGYTPKGYERYAIQISLTVKDFQKEKDFMAAGALMVWAHSVRAVMTPPLRIHGKRMWLELKRGFPSIERAWIGLMAAGLPLGDVDPAECRYIPEMLDQRA